MRNDPAKPAQRQLATSPWPRNQPPAADGSRSVALVLYDGFSPFKALGVACEVFGDNRWVPDGHPWYRLYICADGSDPVTADTGFQILVPHGLETLSQVDTVIVAPTYRPYEVRESVFEALRKAHARGCRMVSFCGTRSFWPQPGFSTAGERQRTGTSARTWRGSIRDAVGRLERSLRRRRRHPDGRRQCCGHRPLPAHRPSGLRGARWQPGSRVSWWYRRSETATRLSTSRHRYPVLDPSDLFADTIAWVQEHLDQQITVEDLAERSAMSPRTFARRFVSATGSAPYQWLLRQPVPRKLARRLLESSDLSIEAVAEEGGFQTASNLRKHFGRVVHTSPKAYREAFMDREIA